ncbi:MAG: hypothetical protein ACR2OR_13795 [Hyphomicrobiales bacterium]
MAKMEKLYPKAWIVITVVFAGLAFSLSADAGEPSVRGSIYDSNAQNLLGVTGATRKKVDEIMAQSDGRMQAVFDKYKINPKGEQHLAKLMEASSELEAIGRWEKAQMKQILTPAEFAKYEKIIESTSERVRKAVE